MSIIKAMLVINHVIIGNNVDEVINIINVPHYVLSKVLVLHGV